MSPAQSLRDKINGLVLQARSMPDPVKAAALLRARARLIEETPLSQWPDGLHVADVLICTGILRRGARDLTECAINAPLGA